MGFYEDKRDGVAHKLLTKFGMTMVIRRPTGETFNATTGEVTGDSVKSYSIKGIVTQKKRSERADLAVKEGFLDLLIEASGLAIVPTTSDKVFFNSTEYDITMVSPISPGGIDVAYYLTVKQP